MLVGGGGGGSGVCQLASPHQAGPLSQSHRGQLQHHDCQELQRQRLGRRARWTQVLVLVLVLVPSRPVVQAQERESRWRVWRSRQQRASSPRS